MMGRRWLPQVRTKHISITGCLLRMQIFRLQPSLTESDSLQAGPRDMNLTQKGLKLTEGWEALFRNANEGILFKFSASKLLIFLMEDAGSSGMK